MNYRTELTHYQKKKKNQAGVKINGMELKNRTELEPAELGAWLVSFTRVGEKVGQGV